MGTETDPDNLVDLAEARAARKDHQAEEEDAPLNPLMAVEQSQQVTFKALAQLEALMVLANKVLDREAQALAREAQARRELEQVRSGEAQLAGQVEVLQQQVELQQQPFWKTHPILTAVVFGGVAAGVTALVLMRERAREAERQAREAERQAREAERRRVFTEEAYRQLEGQQWGLLHALQAEQSRPLQLQSYDQRHFSVTNTPERVTERLKVVEVPKRIEENHYYDQRRITNTPERVTERLKVVEVPAYLQPLVQPTVHTKEIWTKEIRTKVRSKPKAKAAKPAKKRLAVKSKPTVDAEALAKAFFAMNEAGKSLKRRA